MLLQYIEYFLAQALLIPEIYKHESQRRVFSIVYNRII